MRGQMMLATSLLALAAGAGESREIPFTYWLRVRM